MATNNVNSSTFVRIGGLLTGLPAGSQTEMWPGTLGGVLGALHRHAVPIAASALVAVVFAATLRAHGGEGPVTATASVSVPRVAPGESAEVTVMIEIADGWHINAADPGIPFLIPTSLSFDLPAGARVGEILFPQPESRRLKIAGDQLLRLYKGSVRIAATIHYAERTAVAGETFATLKYQACNDTVCLRPASLKLSLALGFAALGGKPPDGPYAVRRLTGTVTASCLAAVAAPAYAGPGIRLEPFSTERYDSARKSGAPFVLEFTAEWCLPCRELEERTFKDPDVIREAQGIRFLSVDMTNPDRRTDLLVQSFRIPGAPTTIIYGPDGKERTRRIGFIEAREFARLLAEAKAAGPRPPSPAPMPAIRNI